MSSSRLRSASSRLFALSFAALLPLLAGDAQISGRVTAQTNASPLPEARVLLHQGGLDRRAATDADGRFVFNSVVPGEDYTLTVEADGFRQTTRPAFSVGIGQSVVMDVALPLADIKESILISDAAVALRSNAPEISQTVSSRQLQELPSNGRNTNRFALLNPHVRNTAGLGAESSAGTRLSINANSFRHTAYALDGTTNYESIYANSPQQSLSLGAVQELKVLTNQYSSEFGTSSAGIILATTRSGSNAFHGEAFAYLRPSAWQAAPPLSTSRVPNEREQWGGSVGGPIRKDKTFFFANYEGVRQERGSFIQSPSPKFFTGRLDEFYSLAKLDQQINDRHSLSLRLNANRSENNNVNDRISGFTQPSAAQLSTSQALGVQLTERSLIGRAVNEVRVAYTNYIPSATTSLFPQVSIVRPNYSTEGGSANSWVRAQSYQFANQLALYWGRHQIKIGAEYCRQLGKDYSYTPFGTYTFAAGAPTPGQNPQSYSQTFGTALLKYGQTIATGYIQDDVKITPRLTANLGLRYEWQTLTKDGNNFAPRLGLAYDVFGDGKTTVRAGAGIFYDQYYFYITRRFYLQGLNSPTATYTIPFGAAGFPTYPNSLSAEPTGVSAARRDLYLPANQLLNPYSLQYSLGVQQQLPGNWVISLDAIHSHTLKQMRANDINAPNPLIRTQPGQRRTAAAADATRPFTTYGGVPVRNLVIVENSGASLYDALDVSVLKRFARRYQVEAHYVLSSSANYSMFLGEPNTGIPNEWNDRGRAERAPSDYYQRHRFVANGLVELPWRTQFSMVATIASGLPVNPLTGADNNGDTYSSDRPVGFGRNSFRGPMQATFDTSFVKRIPLREPLRMELRAEVFNLFNRNNYINLNNVYGEGPAPLATFMKPVAGLTNVDPSRQIQVAVRFVF